MTRVVLASRNRHKLTEVREILSVARGDLEVVGVDGYPELPEVPETAPDFEGNALLKARAVAEHTGLPAVADDSGLCVDELGGMPGVLSARWSGGLGRATGDVDLANLRLVLDQLADTPDDRRGAQFVCAAVLVLPDGTTRSTRGVLPGRLLHAARGSGGFGYDPIFVPDGEQRTTAEMTAEEKNAISHRGRAFTQLAKDLRAVID